MSDEKYERPKMTSHQARQLQNAHADWIEEQIDGRGVLIPRDFQPDALGERLEAMPGEEYSERMGIEVTD